MGKIENGSMSASHRHFRFRRCAAAIAVGVCFSGMAMANPVSPTVVQGQVSFAQDGKALSVTNTPGAIINWQQFSIQKDEVTRFIQQNALSTVLNRVTTQNPSVILGTLTSNGRVFLINPSGIAFGQGAIINVAGLAASTLNISDADFASGRMRFVGTGREGALTNAGTITTPEGGHVYLIAPNVQNQAGAVITSPKGEVVIAAGNTGELVNAQTPDVRVEYTAPANEAVNAGDIVAASGRIGVYGTLVRNSGRVSASAAMIGEGGKIVFTAVKDVILESTSRLEASGPMGGGTILVGGDYQGKNPDVQNAQRTYVASGASINADATQQGDGGKVVVWADGDTRYYGSISARGGANGGNGGNVEVSGKQNLGFSGTVDTAAPKGTMGSLLLDPDDLYISTAAVGAALQDTTNPFQATDSTNDYYVLNTTLQGLAAGTAVVLQANHDIIFQTGLVMTQTGAGSVSMTASNAITMAGFGLSTAGGGVTMTAGAGGITGLGAINLAGGALTLNSSGAMTQNGGSLIAGATSVVKQGSGTLTLSNANTYTGVTTVSAGTLAVTAKNALGTAAAGTTLGSGATLDLQNVAYATAEGVTLNGGTLLTSAGTSSLAGALTQTAASAINTNGTQLTVSGAVNTAGLGITAGGTGSTILSGVVSGTGTLTKQGTGTLTLSGNNTYTGATTISSGTVSINADNRLGTAPGAATANQLVLNGGTLATTATFTLSANRGVTLGASGGAFSQSAGTTLTYTGIIAGAGSLADAGTGTLALGGANTYTGVTNVNAGTLTANSVGALGSTAAGTTVASGATLNINAVAIGAEALTIAGTGVGAAGALQGIGAASLSGAVTLSGGASVGITLAAATLSLTGGISGAGPLTKVGAGTLDLGTTASTYTGATTISAGTLRLQSADMLPDATALTVTGILNLNNFNETVGSLAGAGGVTLGTATLTAGDNTSTTYSGVAAGTGGLTKQGTGTLTLSGNNTYTGATTISGGTLSLGAANRIADTSALVVTGTFDMNGFSEPVGSLAGAGIVTSGAAGAVTLPAGGNNTSTTFSGIAQNGSGTLGVSKAGTGILTFSGANTYTGVTTVAAGTLRLGASGVIADNSAPGGNGNFDLNGFNETVGSLARARARTPGAATLPPGGGKNPPPHNRRGSGPRGPP